MHQHRLKTLLTYNCKEQWMSLLVLLYYHLKIIKTYNWQLPCKHSSQGCRTFLSIIPVMSSLSFFDFPGRASTSTIDNHCTGQRILLIQRTFISKSLPIHIMERFYKHISQKMTFHCIETITMQTVILWSVSPCCF